MSAVIFLAGCFVFGCLVVLGEHVSSPWSGFVVAGGYVVGAVTAVALAREARKPGDGS